MTTKEILAALTSYQAMMSLDVTAPNTQITGRNDGKTPVFSERFITIDGQKFIVRVSRHD
jgi:hypothetical protein